jgi:starch synthase
MVLCRAALEYLRCSGQQPHILHLHEWQTAAASMLYWEVYSQMGLYRPRVVLTIHNLDNTGECRQDEFSFTGQSRQDLEICCVQMNVASRHHCVYWLGAGLG